MARSLLDELVILVVTDPCRSDADVHVEEVLISTSDIDSWDLPEILCYGRAKVGAHRSRLIQESSYFRGLLSGSFSESCLDSISIEWNPETFLDVLRCMYGCVLDITSINFLPLLEAALFFGVEGLLSKCKTWLSVLALSNGPESPLIELDDLINIWNFGLEHASDFVPDSCAVYLAKNFMLVKSNKRFGKVPYELLMCCIKHPHLTVDSEMHLVDAVLVWLDANRRQLEFSKSIQDVLIILMEQVHFSLLPLWFIAVKRKSHVFSKSADQSIDLVIRLMKMSSISMVDMLGNGCPADFRVRLSKYSEDVHT